jgi:hypothetical protein
VGWPQWVPWGPYLPSTRRFLQAEAKKDSRWDNLVAVLKAANRVVVHIDESDVDHPIKVDDDNEVLHEVIDWVEELIESHIYEPNGKSLKEAMKLPSNDMTPPPEHTAFA